MQIGSALIRQTLAYKPELRPSAAAALEEAQSIWLLLLSEKLEANASTEHVSRGDAGVGEENAEDWERMRIDKDGGVRLHTHSPFLSVVAELLNSGKLNTLNVMIPHSMQSCNFVSASSQRISAYEHNSRG